MKVTIIFLDYLRHTYSQQVRDNFHQRAGYPFDLVTIEMKGISTAINAGIKEAMIREADAVVTMANDILMPEQWLAQMVHHAELIPETGTCGFHTVENIGGLTNRHGLDVHEWRVAFGNILIPKKTIDLIGYFNTDFDPYGTQDADYAYRASKMGLIHYYIQGSRAEHIGHDVGDGSEYRKMKDESLEKVWRKGQQWVDYYDRTGNYYLPYEQETTIIKMEQYYGET